MRRYFIRLFVTVFILSAASIRAYCATYSLYQSSGLIQLMGSAYGDDMQETWEIYGTYNQQITFSYSIDVEDGSDYVSIYDMDGYGNMTLIADLTGNQSGTITTTNLSGRAVVTFRSDNCVSGNSGYMGFSVDYSSTPGGGGTGGSLSGSGTTNYLTKFSGSSTLTASSIYDNGKVGIGTVNPAYTLDILGSVRAREVLISLDGVPDYVFGENYFLQPLPQVENYIQAHHHLPDIPSAAEIEKDGISLNKMQVGLLKKVEELTLYTLQRQRQIQDLKAKILQLKQDRK